MTPKTTVLAVVVSLGVFTGCGEGFRDVGEFVEDAFSRDGIGAMDGAPSGAFEGEDDCLVPPTLSVVENCDVDAGYTVNSYAAPPNGDVSLHVIGIYQASSGQAGRGEATVDVMLPGRHILVLNAYEETNWQLNVGPNTIIERVLLFGYESQTLTTTAPVEGEEFSFENGQADFIDGCDFELPATGLNECDARSVVGVAEEMTGLSVTSFNGCYDASDFILSNESICSAFVPDVQPAPDVTPTDVIRDCDGDLSSTRVASENGENLILGSVYQTRSDYSAGFRPMGDAVVTFALPGDNVLVLSAYEPTTWKIDVADGGQLDRVILVGYHEQVAEIVGADVPIDVFTYDNGASPEETCGFELPHEGGGCDTDALIAYAERLANRSMTAFDGCHRATEFIYGD